MHILIYYICSNSFMMILNIFSLSLLVFVPHLVFFLVVLPLHNPPSLYLLIASSVSFVGTTAEIPVPGQSERGFSRTKKELQF